MEAHRSNHQTRAHKKLDLGETDHNKTELSNREVTTFFGGLIGLILTSLLSLLVFASIVWSFIAQQAEAYQVLNTATTIVGTTLGGVVGYLLGRSTGSRA